MPDNPLCGCACHRGSWTCGSFPKTCGCDTQWQADDRELLTNRTRARGTRAYVRTPRYLVAPKAYKRHIALTVGGCEVCGWCLHPEDWEALHCHHVVPVACGGTDEASNLIVLCPNHHAVAHRTGKRRGKRWHGPQTRDALLEAIARYGLAATA